MIYLYILIGLIILGVIGLIGLFLNLEHKHKQAIKQGDIYLNKKQNFNHRRIYNILQSKILTLPIPQDQRKDLIFWLDKAKDKRTLGTLYNFEIMEQVNKEIRIIEKEGEQWKN